ncbi:hypothetical protein DK847_01510 [Aestuariivirga litoralis]|uniref:Uncharacterized protein n=1 Tax=Aestuariivirga litoralis TaxID=2650924 RepID=A0A2W2BYH6_9HYPH|nr:DUF692 domain-containing protein [Aestuariivirga litoralis]PZF78516.1 hypothetical protein DK847_01510 [Aestuariivirga litoralis]
MTKPFSFRQAGVGLRLEHLAKVLRDRPAAAWFEVHPENVLANPHAAEMLAEIAALYPLSIHSVGISAGSASGLDRTHLARVRGLVTRLDPVLLSGHLAWSTHDGEYLNDLLPLPYHAQSLDVICRHIAEIQDALGMVFHLENPSNYLGFAESTMTETAFLTEVVKRTGCRLLCDVSNIHVSAHNMGYDARRYVDELPGEAIGEFHLGGFELETEPGGTSVIIDTHARPIATEAWDLYAYAIHRFGPRPTLIEWDSALPAMDVLLAEAAKADRIAEQVLVDRHALAV